VGENEQRHEYHPLAGKTLSNGVVFVPGEFFYCNEPDQTTLRMSFVTPTDEQLKEAVRRLKKSL
jgi:DNA-binding transcriptional MocR family regulator